MRHRRLAPGDREVARQACLGGEKVVVARIEAAVGKPITDREELAVPVEEKREVHPGRQRLGRRGDRDQAGRQCLRGTGLRDRRGRRSGALVSGPRGVEPHRLVLERNLLQSPRTGRAHRAREPPHLRRLPRQRVGRRRGRRQQVAAMARDRALQRMAPGLDLVGPIARVAPRGRARHGGERVGVRRQRVEARHQRLARPQRNEPLLQAVDRPLQQTPARGASLGEAGVVGGISNQPNDVAESREDGVRGERPLSDLEAGLLDDEQVGEEISAVDGRDVSRLEGSERLGVVPVVEMPPKTVEAARRGDQRLEALGGLRGADPPEIVGGGRREERQADVGRGRPVRDDGSGILLKIVGGQMMVVRTGERFEESPRSPSHRPEQRLARGGQRIARRAHGVSAELPRHERRARPQNEEHERGRRDARRAQDGGEEHPRGRDRDRDGVAPHESRRGEVVLRAGLRARRPFEQPPAGPVDAAERPGDRVGHEPRLVGQQNDRCDGVRAGQNDVRQESPQHAPLGGASPMRDCAGEHGEEARHENRGQHEGRPDDRDRAREGPADDQRGDRERRHEGAADVVEDLPQTHRRQRVAPQPPRRVGHASRKPAEQLPVAPRPPVLAGGGHLVVRRELLEELDVGDEAGPREEALEEVVREERVLRHAARESALERVDVVDALARVDRLVEEVLIDVGDGERIRVDPPRTGEEEAEEGLAARRRQRGRHPRLHDAVSRHDPGPGLVEDRPVQRMRHGADELSDGAPRKPRVAIEGDDVANARARRFLVRQEGGVRGATKEPVELVELAALALPAHPAALRRVPDPPAVEQMEPRSAVGSRSVPLVELGHGIARRREEPRIFLAALPGRIDPVGQESEGDVPVRIGQEPHLELLDLSPRLVLRHEERRHDDQGRQLLGDAFLELELGQTARTQELRDVAVENGHGDLRSRDEREKPEQRDRADARAQVQRGVHGNENREQRQDAHRQGIPRIRTGDPGRPDPMRERGSVSDLALELGPPPGDQVIAGVGPRTAGGFARRRAPRHGPAGDLLLGHAAALRESLDRIAVPIARREVHRPDARSLGEHLRDEADALEEVGPVGGRQQAHARDHVAHRDVRRHLGPLCQLHEFVPADALARHPGVNPAERRGRLGILVSEPEKELDDERRRQRSLQDTAQRDLGRGPPLLARAERVGEGVRLLPLGAMRDDELGEAPQVLREHEAKRDRERPELADRQRADRLIGGDEPAKGVEIDPAVGVGDVGPGDLVDARSSREGTADELRQLAVVTGGKVVADLPKLVFHDVEVVRHPFGRGRNRLPIADRFGDVAIALDEDPAVLLEPGEESDASATGEVDPVGARQLTRPFFEAIGTEQVAANGIESVGLEPARPPKSRSFLPACLLVHLGMGFCTKLRPRQAGSGRQSRPGGRCG